MRTAFVRTRLGVSILRPSACWCLFVLGAGSLLAEDWPQFRGPNCTGVSTSSKRLPSGFSATKNVRWSATLGDSVSAPAVVSGRVFSTAWAGKKGEEKFVLFCFDAGTGKALWQR